MDKFIKNKYANKHVLHKTKITGDAYIELKNLIKKLDIKTEGEKKCFGLKNT